MKYKLEIEGDVLDDAYEMLHPKSQGGILPDPVVNASQPSASNDPGPLGPVGGLLDNRPVLKLLLTSLLPLLLNLLGGKITEVNVNK